MIEHNPVSIERELIESVNELGRAVMVRNELYRAKQATARDRKRAYLTVFSVRNGLSVKDREAAGELAAMAEEEAMDDADAAWRYGENRARALEVKISALQSIKKSVDQAYQSGVGTR